MSVFIETVFQGNLLGEAPHWDSSRQQLYFVDLTGHKFNRYDPATRQTTQLNLDANIGFGVPVEGDPTKFVIAQGRYYSLLEWDGDSSSPTSLQTIAEADPGNPRNILNDGKCDRRGRLWCGTAVQLGEPINSASLYKLDLEAQLSRQLGGVGISNGLAWNSAGDTMYYIDTPTRRVDAFTFNEEEGTIDNRRTVFTLAGTSLGGLPDGMTIDTSGNLWVALFNGSNIIQVDPNSGQLVREINLPTRDITSSAWGGPNLDQLYVTTGGTSGDERAGSVFRLTNIGVRGVEGGSNYKGTIPPTLNITVD